VGPAEGGRAPSLVTSGGGPARPDRRPVKSTITAVLAVALVGLTVMVTVATGSAVHRQAPEPTLPATAAAVQAALKGIPQNGLALGRASAHVTIYEYADLICATCAKASSAVVDPVIVSFVRSGLTRLVLEPISESPRSQQFALGAYAAGAQHAGWDYAELAYLRSTPRSDGPVDSPLALARALGLRVGHWSSSFRRPRWANQIEQAARVALIGGFANFPVFVVSGPPRRVRGRRRFVTILKPPVRLAQLSSAIRSAAKAHHPATAGRAASR
jgi:hypothetical protein